MTTRLLWKLLLGNSHQLTRRGDNRPGVSFMFNLTSNGLESLVSAMTTTVSVNATALINNATVNCGDEAYPKVLHVNEGEYKSLK